MDFKKEETDKINCEICDCNFNKTTRRRISCFGCDLTYCYSCLKNFMKTIDNELYCMGCKSLLSISFIKEYTPKSFIRNELKDLHDKVFFEQQKSLLPSSVHLVEIENEKERLRKENKNILQKIHELRLEINLLYKKRGDNLEIINKGKVSVKKKDYKFKCQTENCRGFLSEDFDCAVCKTKFCKDCLNPMEEEHKCNPDDVESFKLIRRQTKPCPGCGTRVQKSEGCNHMWCTKPGCETGFDWKTGKKIANSQNTNPYYYEWTRKNKITTRNPGDVRCGGIPFPHTILANLKNKGYVVDNQLNFFQICQCVNHIITIELPYYLDDGDKDELLSQYRVMYLMKKITEERWKEYIFADKKHFDKKRDIYNVLQTLTETMTDFLITLSRRESTEDEIINVLTSIEKIREYTNKQFRSLLDVYNNQMPFINKYWQFTTLTTKKTIKPMGRPIGYMSESSWGRLNRRY